MSRIRLYIALIIAFAIFGCVRKTLHQMPSVDLVVSWENSRDKTHADALFYLYPQFNYSTEPMKIDAIASKSQSLSLLPGRYKVLMHNTPCAPLVIADDDSFDKMSVSIAYDHDASDQLSQFMVLGATDPAREINVQLGERNKFEFKPISGSKKIRFVINGDDKFGLVDIVDASLSGVVSKVNMSTLRIDQIDEIMIDKWEVSGHKFTSEPREVLGFDQTDDIILNLIIQSPESDYPKEQPIDLTDELRNLEGDQVLITMDVEYNPDIRVRKVTIKEWLAGNEIDIDIQ